MLYTETEISGVVVVDLERRSDERGWFSRAWCADEFRRHRLADGFVQANVGFSARRGTLRGLHHQAAPHEEAKLVRCTRGAVFDVAVDLRPDSTTLGRWVGAELSADNGRMLYVPEGCAHGYLTLADETEVYYQTTALYEPTAQRGAHYADPALGIAWPIDVEVISDRDRTWPFLAIEAGRSEL